MSFIIRLQDVDFEEYNSGSTYGEVGPFDSREDAERFLDESPKYTSQHRLYKGRYGWSGYRTHVQIVDPFKFIKSPSDWK